MRLKISAQASFIIRQCKNFDMEDFLGYLKRDGFPIGSGNVLEYLQVKDCRENGDSKPRVVEIDV